MTTDTTTEIVPTPPPKDEIPTMIEVPTLPETTKGKTKTIPHNNEITEVEIHREDTSYPNPNNGDITTLTPDEQAKPPYCTPKVAENTETNKGETNHPNPKKGKTTTQNMTQAKSLNGPPTTAAVIEIHMDDTTLPDTNTERDSTLPPNETVNHPQETKASTPHKDESTVPQTSHLYGDYWVTIPDLN